MSTFEPYFADIGLIHSGPLAIAYPATIDDGEQKVQEVRCLIMFACMNAYCIKL